MVKSSTWSVFNTAKEERQTITYDKDVTEEEAKKEISDFFKMLFPICPGIDHLQDWKPAETP
ncbi:hypothetical protein [uncultured Methanolobus sp.]|uniref:hypothetical protein n=1 Tax=uncultured Methanolobus sp. TaxID=218300 RepID=UPI0029C6A7A5|nr:hypothetical protein [uncultured Methanolobus sp.]